MSNKKFFILCSVISVLLFFKHDLIYATENEGVSYEPPQIRMESEGGISTRGTDKPLKDKIYTNNQYVSFWGSAEHSTLFTDYNFYNVYQITCIITNNADSDLEVTLCDHFSMGDYSERQTFTISGNSTKTLYFRDLNKNRYYFLRFSAPSDFSGKALGFQE